MIRAPRLLSVSALAFCVLVPGLSPVARAQMGPGGMGPAACTRPPRWARSPRKRAPPKRRPRRTTSRPTWSRSAATPTRRGARCNTSSSNGYLRLRAGLHAHLLPGPGVHVDPHDAAHGRTPWACRRSPLPLECSRPSDPGAPCERAAPRRGRQPRAVAPTRTSAAPNPPPPRADDQRHRQGARELAGGTSSTTRSSARRRTRWPASRATTGPRRSMNGTAVSPTAPGRRPTASSTPAGPARSRPRTASARASAPSARGPRSTASSARCASAACPGTGAAASTTTRAAAPTATSGRRSTA